jgi:hypothetical protein
MVAVVQFSAVDWAPKALFQSFLQVRFSQEAQVPAQAVAPIQEA